MAVTGWSATTRPTPAAARRSTLLHDDDVVASVTLDVPVPMFWQHGGTALCLGCDRGFPVCDDYEVPFAWNGALHEVVVEVGRQMPPDPGLAIRVALATRIGVLLTDRHVALLVTGISASGKSTVAEMLARRFERGVHVRGDVFRRMVVAGRAEMTADPTSEAWRQLRLRYSLGAATADVYFAAGFSVVLQDLVVGEVLAEYVGMIASRPLCVVVLMPQPDVVTAREAERTKTAYRADSMTSRYSIPRCVRATPRIGLWLDTSQQTPEETVDDIAARAWNEARVA